MPNFYEAVVNEQKTRKKAEMQENRTICYQSAIAYEEGEKEPLLFCQIK